MVASTATEKKPRATRKPALIEPATRTPQGRRQSLAAKERTVARTTAPSRAIPKSKRSRFALNPPKIERFFARAIRRESLVTLTLDDGSKLADLVPIAITEETYRAKNGRMKNVPKRRVTRIDTEF
jgi:hypothetical protein